MLTADEPSHLSRPARTHTGLPLSEYHPQDGDHLCSIWTDPERDRAAAREFLVGDADEAALWVQDPSRGPLHSAGDDPSRITAFSTREVYVPDGTFNPGRMYDFWRERVVEARGRGARRLRIVAEMAWSLEARPGTERAAAYESALTDILGTLPISVICQYGSTRFHPDTVLAMLLSHPLVVIGERVFHNPFHVPDDVFAESFERLSADLVGALMPMWRHYLAVLPNWAEVGAFLCNSLPSLVLGASVTVQFAGRSHAWHLDTAREALQEIDVPAVGSRATSRLFAVWPRSSDSLGGSVQTGSDGAISWVEASFGDHARGIVLSRPARFARGELLVFTALAGAVSSALVHSRSLAGRAGGLV